MARRPIPLDTVRSLAEQGLGVTAIAKELGFSKAGICGALKRINFAVTREVTTRVASEIVQRKIDAMGQVSRINQTINNELDYLARKIQTCSDKEREAFQNQQLRHVAEIRKQVGLFLDITRALYNIEEIKEFQQLVLEVIKNHCPKAYEQITNEIRSLRPT